MKKGSFGYLRTARKNSLIKSGLFLAAVLIIYFGAYFYFHTNRNVFSILAGVGALPTGRSIVATIMFMRAREASEQVHDAVEKVSGIPAGCSGYDLYLTAYERSYSLSHAAVVDGTVIGLTEDEKTDCRLCEQHIQVMVRKDGHIGYQVHIFRDLDKYIGELRDLCARASAADDAADDEQAQGSTVEEDRAVMNMIFGISI